ncbi:MAG: hypothetical protein PHU85_01470 [Phycisphaerae bacterium]|nr:hypothetical protein [Phycisphaerae bacterium]
MRDSRNIVEALLRNRPVPRMAMQIVDEFGARDGQGKPLAGDYLAGPLSGLEFHQLPKPRRTRTTSPC